MTLVAEFLERMNFLHKVSKQFPLSPLTIAINDFLNNATPFPFDALLKHTISVFDDLDLPSKEVALKLLVHFGVVLSDDNKSTYLTSLYDKLILPILNKIFP